mmetsp:Transcript_25655/g.71781  ORF Transcript_25655/g.71781 Transcript_25655/m.71781 type:complete len:149 (-) Transcript_25655:2443-2889(-)
MAEVGRMQSDSVRNAEIDTSAAGYTSEETKPFARLPESIAAVNSWVLPREPTAVWKAAADDRRHSTSTVAGSTMNSPLIDVETSAQVAAEVGTQRMSSSLSHMTNLPAGHISEAFPLLPYSNLRKDSPTQQANAVKSDPLSLFYGYSR